MIVFYLEDTGEVVSFDGLRSAFPNISIPSNIDNLNIPGVHKVRKERPACDPTFEQVVEEFDAVAKKFTYQVVDLDLPTVKQNLLSIVEQRRVADDVKQQIAAEISACDSVSAAREINLFRF